MRITGAARVAGLVGSPISGSLSPTLHNAWLAEAGLDGAYVPLELADEAAFRALVNGLRGGRSMRGVNVTAPFKEAALSVADRVDVAAQAAGAANLLLFETDGSVSARNTDGSGLLYALQTQAGGAPEGGVVVILGAGGAARGAASTLLSAGVSQVRVVNRTFERAGALAEHLGGGVSAWSWAEAEQAASGAALLVNATTLGRTGGDALAAPLNSLAPGAVVMDMVYRPIQTPLLQEAKALGFTPVDGLAMLIGQAIPTFEALFDQPPPDIDVRAIAMQALG